MSLADLSTEELAMFQMIEAGFVGIGHGITLLRAESASAHEAEQLFNQLTELKRQNYPDSRDIAEALQACLDYFAKRSETSVAVLTLFKPSIRPGEDAVQPVAILLLDPSDVINPVMEHTDGAGNVKNEEQETKCSSLRSYVDDLKDEEPFLDDANYDPCEPKD